ncbi:serine-rich adhesin for platelets-like [Neodiprion virginianus]|uniref:serine-rich adhesin for platelets-like n=1 Tax=Neodiprion virginianus TaxID=2961670 RepID=UPI001EE6C9D4|nr:serine-rich adhesin for platelets-like [Neodiprion virginianus]
MEILKNGHEEFVTVVSVGNADAAELENFVTVLSIGNETDNIDGVKKRSDNENGAQVDDDREERNEAIGPEAHPEEEVDVFRLPGERLGFGLKFEGGNKTSEKVRKLFVQSCASESPASRAVCSWGTLGEGDEVLSIDGVPVTEMTRLDCVRRLKESQLVIKLLVRYRGALRPEVVSAERKSSPEKRIGKVPPELPAAPPPVPPRKLRQPRGPADGDANPSPVRKPVTWDSPKSTGSSSSSTYNSTEDQSTVRSQGSSCSKSASFESCNSAGSSKSNSKNSSPNKNSTTTNNVKTQSPDMNKSRLQEPAEALVYLDARSHDGCSSTQGSTSDDTGSSMSTVIDRFSSSDRFSIKSTTSTASTASEHPQNPHLQVVEKEITPPATNQQQNITEAPVEISAADNVDLVRLLAPFDHLEREFGSNPPSSDYLLARLANSEAVTFVESLGDGGDGVVERVTAVVAPNTVLIEETITLQPPLSFQDAPLSYGHETRPGLVYTDLAADSTTHFRPIKDDALVVECVNGNVDQVVRDEGPPLPARNNHVNRISVNRDTSEEPAPALPPKPMPRRDVKAKRKRPPPPPPPPPRRDIQPPPETKGELEEESRTTESGDVEKKEEGSSSEGIGEEEETRDVMRRKNERNLEISGTNKIMEIIEMKKAKAMADGTKSKDDVDSELSEKVTVAEEDDKGDDEETETPVDGRKEDEKITYWSLDEVGNELRNSEFADTILGDAEVCNDDEDSTDDSDGDSYYWQSNLATIGEEEETNSLEFTNANRNLECSEEDSTHLRKGDDQSSRKVNCVLQDQQPKTDSVAKDEDEVDCLRRDAISPNTGEVREKEFSKSGKGPVNGRMESCGGGQRLPPDGDEFPATYQEFSSAQQQHQHQQQYQFVAGSRVSSTLASSNGEQLVTSGDTEVFSSSETLKLPSANDKKKIIASSSGSSSSNDFNCEEKTILLQDSRVFSLRSSVQSSHSPVVLFASSSETPVVVPKDVKITRKINAAPNSMDDSYSLFNGSNTEKNIISEKIITINVPKGGTEAEFITETGPPPLPTSRPPKVDGFPTSSSPVVGKGVLRGSQQQQQSSSSRKFSLNGDLWRQDDKSEKSVRDKIAMFSSQSSLEAPLFPSITVSSSTSTTPTIRPSSRRLSKYKSSEDVFAEDARNSPRDNNAAFSERTRSSFDLSIPSPNENYDAPPPSLPLTSPPASPGVKTTPGFAVVTKKIPEDAPPEPNPKANHSLRHSSSLEFKSGAPSGASVSPSVLQGPKSLAGLSASPVTPLSTTLTRATSFSGSSANLHSRSQSLSELPPSSQISRTNSLASTFKRPNEDMRRTSLNQLIEQRRKGIRKLRGLVIPEKEALPVSQPIVQDLPEIKSRDSIILQQLPRSNLQDKWGSQSSISSSISTISVPGKISSFKMPEPQNLPKYSPAFKRKSLAVYGTSGTLTPGKNSSSTTSAPSSEAPKSLESICSPTRSDFSFEYSPSDRSPRSRANLRKARTDYDDSDNDSAVSSSQSSISRGFSPPVSPVPSERSTLSSERSYLSNETTTTTSTNYLQVRSEHRAATLERSQFLTRPSSYSQGSFSERSSSSSSSPDPRSPQQSGMYSRNGLQHLALKRSSSTDTNCSSSSTLTSGSQASAESLSRRVLKPQSVEAINRKNILASARCRSGGDLNGSPQLIQRKFSDDEDPAPATSKLALQKNGDCVATDDVKIAYIEVTAEEDSQPIRGSELLEPSNEMRKWVRSEVKTVVNNRVEKDDESITAEKKRAEIEVQVRTPRRRSSLAVAEEKAQVIPVIESDLESSKPRSRSSMVIDKSAPDSQNDLLTVLSTRGRSRTAIHIEDRSFGRSRSQMSLEEILDGKAEEAATPSGTPSRSWNKDKGFASKIPTKVVERVAEDESPKIASRIPTPRSMGRRSASVTDVKKTVEKSEAQGLNQQPPIPSGNFHGRFSSLDSSSGDIDTERYSAASEQFGSISSLASSTSLISQQELAQLVEEATLEEARGAHDVIVVLYHKENPAGSVGIALAGGVDCETKEITVHRVLAHSIADKDGRLQRGDRILSINGRSTKGLTHRESLAVLKQPRSEVVLVVSRARDDFGVRLRSRTESVETIVEGSEMNGSSDEQTAWGPPATVAIFKDGAGLGFSLEGGRDSPLGDRPLIVKKIFAGGAAEKTGALRAGDQMLEVNGHDVTRMSRIEAWSLMKKLHDGEVSLLVRHPATKSSS